jgi:hypothetical protein
MSRVPSLSRRAAIGTLAGALCPLAAASAQAPPRKTTKAQAEYQDTPKGILMCATCTLFLQPDACKVVEGKVSPQGWCNAFDFAD